MEKFEIEERMEWIDKRVESIDYEVGCLQHEQDELNAEWLKLENKLADLEECPDE